MRTRYRLALLMATALMVAGTPAAALAVVLAASATRGLRRRAPVREPAPRIVRSLLRTNP
jgi:hypothetical protein